MNHLSPADADVIQEYIGAARRFTRFDLMDLAIATPSDLPGILSNLSVSLKWFRTSVAAFAERFTDPFLRRTFPLIQYSNPDLPMAPHLNILAGCHTGEHGWPAGGSLEFARSIARRYRELGGEIHYRARVEEILVEQDRAVGVRLAGGTKYRANVVISNAYGPATIFGLLGGRYTNRQIRARYATPADQIEMGVHVSLGVARDLSQESHALVLLLDRPVTLAGQVRDRLDLALFGFDPSMAPPGKGVLKVELPASYAYWKELYQDRGRYREEKDRLAETVIDLLEPRFPGLRGQIEVVDVATPMTMERYTGNATGFETTFGQILLGMVPGMGPGRTLPGLKGFYMVGQWAGSPGLPNVAGMARSVVRGICRRDGRPFVASPLPRALPALAPRS
jgi:phytoene dehydrogenase-like protein